MCVCKLISSVFLVVNVILVTCFNIDQVNYALYELDQSRSMFGFTVAVHKDKLNEGWVLVGAPEAQSSYQDPAMVLRGGAVYKCSSRTDDRCQEIPFDRQNNVFIGNNMIDEKSGRWFGATLNTAGSVDGPVVACAPRYVWFTKDLNRRDPVGTCYVSNGAFDNFEEYSPCRTMNWGYHRQGSCQAGFSAAINRVGDRLYVGAPGSYYWQGQMYSIDAYATFNYTPGYFGNQGYGAKGSVHQQSLENRPAVFSTREGKAPDDDSYIGYSTVVGHFKEGERYEGIAVGMPRGNKLKGKVLLFTWDLKNYKNITVSTQIGSYFGYSITAADVNGDKKMDLIVGAPIHTEPNTQGKYDVGRVYVLYQSSNFLESFNVSHYIDGINSKGRFGHAVASLGDLNQDGYDDFAVGAPYDGPNGLGAVYIYYGSQEGIRKKFGQVIYAETIRTNKAPLATFGFSLAGGMDLDGNEYPDMAVGAYLSDAAFFFRSRPVVRVESFVRFNTSQKQIDLKQKNCILPNGKEGTCTAIDFCIRYSGKGIPEEIDLLVTYILDSKKPNTPRMGFLDRRGVSSFNETLRLYKDNRDYCKRQEVYINNDIRDKLTPLEAQVQYSMLDEYHVDAFEQTRNPRSLLRPALDLNNPPSKKDSINIQKNCGPDNICIPNLHVNVTSSVEKYMLGSDKDLEFDVIVSNFGEDSFETTLEMKYPERIFYRKIETKPNIPGILCSPSENRTIICDIGNPLPSGRIASFKMLMQPHKAEGMAPSYEFDVYVNSSNPEPEATSKDNHQHISVGIWIDASLELRGESYPSTVRYNESLYTAKNITKENEIGPQVTHVYYLTNRGPATVQEAEVFLLWPLTTVGGEDLLYLLDQPHTQGNIKCDAALSNYKHYELDYHRASIWDRLKIDISGVETTSAQKFAQGKSTEIGRGVSSGVGVVNINKNVTVPSGDASQLYESRHSQTNVNTQLKVNPNGEYESTEARYTTTWENGVPITKWENITTVKDAKGNVLRTFYSNDNTDSTSTTEGSGLNFGNINANGEYVHTEARFTKTWTNGVPIIKWHNVTTVRDSQGNILRTYHSDDEAERQNQIEERKLTDEELGRKRLEADRQRQIEEQRERERQEQARRRYEEERQRHEEEMRKQEEVLRRQEEERIRLEEIRRQKEKEERRRQELAYEERRRGQAFQPNHQWRTEEERRRYYEEERRRQEAKAREEHAYEVGGGAREGGSMYYGGSRQYAGGNKRIQTGYFDEQGVYHDLPKDPSGQAVFNRTYTYESSTSIPIDIGIAGGAQGIGDSASGSDFRVHTLDLGNVGNSGGGYRREWKTEGGYSRSGQLPPTIVGDNVPLNSEPVESRSRVRGRRQIERDPYAEIQKLIKCNSTNCIYIRCVVGVLEKDKEVALALRSRLNVRAVKDLTSAQPIRVSSMLIGKISKLPYVGEVEEKTLRKHEIFSDIPAKEAELVPEVAPLWIYVVSAVAGTVMLLLLIWLLSKCGFFKRNRPSSAPERQPLNRNGYHHGDEAL